MVTDTIFFLCIVSLIHEVLSKVSRNYKPASEEIKSPYFEVRHLPCESFQTTAAHTCLSPPCPLSFSRPEPAVTALLSAHLKEFMRHGSCLDLASVADEALFTSDEAARLVYGSWAAC